MFLIIKSYLRGKNNVCLRCDLHLLWAVWKWEIFSWKWYEGSDQLLMLKESDLHWKNSIAMASSSNITLLLIQIISWGLHIWYYAYRICQSYVLEKCAFALWQITDVCKPFAVYMLYIWSFVCECFFNLLFFDWNRSFRWYTNFFFFF